MYVAEPVLAAAGERIAKQLPVARGTTEGMVWEEMGRGEDDDEFLVDWKTQVCAVMMVATLHTSDQSDVLIAPLTHPLLSQMCELLQPLRDNMAQAGNFVQVVLLFSITTTWQRCQHLPVDTRN